MADTARTLTLVHTDIQGSTRLWERLGRGFAEVLAAHNRILRDAAADLGGREIETEGDSFTFAFDSAPAALRFAMRAQVALHAHPWPPPVGELLVRIGVHSGTASVHAEAASRRPRVFGPLDARCRLVAGAAHGGQTILSAAARAATAPAHPEAVLSDLGEHRLAPGDPLESLAQALPPSLASRSFPPPRTASARPTNILADRGMFVGREAELAVLQDLFAGPAGRLVTLTGPGGIGKTRLARQAALAALPSFERGVWFADLQESRGPADIAQAVAHALGVPLSGGGDPCVEVADTLEFRMPCLVVLDGFEAVLEHAAATVGAWSKRARDARFLITSAAILGLSGERELQVPPLSTPDAGRLPTNTEEALRFESVRLFAERAAAHGFRVDDAVAADVAGLCADLEGIPLAIELAAARAAEETPAGMRRGREAPGRPALERTLAWSYARLTPPEQSAFRQACVFRGGFYLEAAEEVIDLSPFPDAPLALDALQTLRDRSFLRTRDTSLGIRLSTFRALRDFGESLPAPGDERTAAERRHAAYFAEAATRWSARRGAESGEALERVACETENLLAVLARAEPRAGEPAAAAVGVRAALALDFALAWRGPLHLRLDVLERASRLLSAPPHALSLAFAALTETRLVAGRTEEAAAAASEAVRLADASGQPAAIATAAYQASRIPYARSDFPAARSELARAAEMARAAGDVFLLSRTLDLAALVERLAGDLAASERHLAASLDIARRSGDPIEVARAAANAGMQRAQKGDLREALAFYEEAERALRHAGSLANEAKIAGMRASVLLDLGETDEAEKGILRAISVARETGARSSYLRQITSLGNLRRRQNRIAEARDVLEEAVRMARHIGDDAAEIAALGNLAGALFEAGESDLALQSFREAAARARKTGNLSGYALHVGNAGIVLQGIGRGEEARDLLREALDLWRTMGIRRTLKPFNVLVALSNLEAAAGREAEARAAAAEAVACAEELDRAGVRWTPSQLETIRTLRDRAAGGP